MLKQLCLLSVERINICFFVIYIFILLTWNSYIFQKLQYLIITVSICHGVYYKTTFRAHVGTHVVTTYENCYILASNVHMQVLYYNVLSKVLFKLICLYIYSFCLKTFYARFNYSGYNHIH